MALTNWAGNYTYGARAVHRPSTLEELQAVVARAPALRVLGSGHSFTGIADSAELVSLDALPPEFRLDADRGTATVAGWMRYGELATALDRHGWAVANLASLPHIAVAGALMTATHGSGDHNGNLATTAVALELVTSDGEARTLRRGDPDFEGAVVGLGALGAVTRVTLDLEPAFEVSQRVFGPLSWTALFEHFDAIMASGYSVSAFTRWGAQVDQVWIKRRLDQGPDATGEELFGALAARTPQHPIAGLDPVHCTAQLGQPGPWYDRLPHFRMGFRPSSGAELQSEYMVDRRHAVAALEAVRGLSDTLRPLTQVSEIRTVAADRLWMSPQYERNAVGIHFTWRPDQPAVERALAALEAALIPFAARPHWGKLFLARADTLASLYARRDDFLALLDRLDPRGAFSNPWLERHVRGGA